MTLCCHAERRVGRTARQRRLLLPPSSIFDRLRLVQLPTLQCRYVHILWAPPCSWYTSSSVLHCPALVLGTKLTLTSAIVISTMRLLIISRLLLGPLLSKQTTSLSTGGTGESLLTIWSRHCSQIHQTGLLSY
jgi:hypothetical protein